MCGFSSKQTYFSKTEDTFQKIKKLRHALENVTNCPSVLPFLPPSCLQKWNLTGKSQACTTALLRLLTSHCASLCNASRFILHVLQSSARSHHELVQLDHTYTPTSVSCNPGFSLGWLIAAPFGCGEFR